MNNAWKSLYFINNFLKKFSARSFNFLRQLFFRIFDLVVKISQKLAMFKLPMYTGKVTVWCGLWIGSIIGPQFFKDAANRNVTVNGERCSEMISIFFARNAKLGSTARVVWSALSNLHTSVV